MRFTVIPAWQSIYSFKECHVIAFVLGPLVCLSFCLFVFVFVCLSVCLSSHHLVRFWQLLRCADKHIVNIIKVYTERSKMQV